MSKPSVLINKATGEILKRGNYPREDMGDILGLDPNLEWLVINVPFDYPDYDSRLFVLNQVEEVTSIAHPDYANLNQYKITYAVTKRPDTDVVIHIENAEIEANESVIGYKNKTKLMALALGVLIRRLDNLQTTTKEQRILDKALQNAVRIWKNDAEVRAKLQQLTDGIEPDIDSGWEKEE